MRTESQSKPAACAQWTTRSHAIELHTLLSVDAVAAEHTAHAGALVDLHAAAVAAPFRIDGAEAFAAGAEEAEAASFGIVSFGLQVLRVGEIDVVACHQCQRVVGVEISGLCVEVVAHSRAVC